MQPISFKFDRLLGASTAARLQGKYPHATSLHATRWWLAVIAAATFTGCGTTKTTADVPVNDEGTIIYAAGDIAQCGKKPPAEAGTGRTAGLLVQTTGPILALGDLVYPNGSYADFATCFEPTWGELKPRILPVPGNHEYLTPRAGPYFAYFGAAAGEPGKGYYSTRIGAWHIVALNSNIDAETGSAQERWLRDDLAANRIKCTLVFWHHPVFSSAVRGFDPQMQDIWKTLYAAGVDVVLNGHEHQYERFAPQDPEGARDSLRGIREFVVGTGGANTGAFGIIQLNSESRETGIFGALRLTLREDGYTWKFLPVAGQKFNDSGEGRCHGK